MMRMQTSRDPAALERKARWLRRTLFEMMLAARQGHPGSVLSQVEIVVALYYAGYIRSSPESRDRFIVSKGHATMGIYPILADLGYFDAAELAHFGEPGALLSAFGHRWIPGIAATTGSLGHGPGFGAGYALAARGDGADARIAVLISEGELYEGSVWEAALFAAHQKLDNLVLVIDRNRNIILGDTEELLALEPLEKKWQSFGFRTLRADGHSFAGLLAAFDQAFVPAGAPTVVIADTVKGKGVAFMEGRPEWHYWRDPAEAQVAAARRELAEGARA